MSNAAARDLLGVAIEGVDVRQVLPHPAVVQRLVRGRIQGPEEVEATGFGGSRRAWLVRIAPLGAHSNSPPLHALRQWRRDLKPKPCHKSPR